MKAISLWQPWASAMAHGAKRNETRSWSTAYRGDLVICSAQRKASREECGDEAPYQHAMKQPYGAAVCVVELYDCVKTQNIITNTDKVLLPLRTITEQEWEMGDYTPGRFAWLTRNLRRLATPVPVIGRQGFWNLPPDVVAKIAVQLAPEVEM